VPKLSMVLVLTTRNLLYVALFLWAVVALVAILRRPRDQHPDGGVDAAALDWMDARR
jgi:hypothetical protein